MFIHTENLLVFYLRITAYAIDRFYAKLGIFTVEYSPTSEVLIWLKVDLVQLKLKAIKCSTLSDMHNS